MNQKSFWAWAIGFTVIAEVITIICRIVIGQSAAEFNRTNPPFLMQIHHMFWSVPFIGLGVWGEVRQWQTHWIWGLVFGLIASDLIHHFVVLPLWVGNTGWHWP